ncbi:MAG: hypothetical protein R3B54_10220 [Bdellovibrionota bacterium]
MRPVYSFVALILLTGTLCARAGYVDLGPLEFGSLQSATALCAPDQHEKCPKQKGIPTPLVAGEVSATAFRVQSFGDTQITLVLKSPEKVFPYLRVEGPLKESGDAIQIGEGKTFAESESTPGQSVRLDLSLKEAGVYRILATTESVKDGKEPDGNLELELTSSCKKNCSRPTLSAREFLKKYKEQLIDKSSLEPFVRGRVEAALPKTELDEDRSEFEILVRQLKAFLAGETDRFPILPPLPELSYLRPLVAGLESRLAKITLSPKKEVKGLTGSVQEILATAKTVRHYPAPLDKRVAEVTYGHFPSETLSPTQAKQSDVLAEILNSLAEGKEALSFQTKKGKRTLHTPWDLFDVLIASGHSIEVRNERTYANFISLNDGLTSVQWPVWLDSGVALSSGDKMIAPVGHSQHAWRIRGPEIDARIMFYLGISGVGFWAQTDERPAWTGNRVAYSVSSDKDKAFVLATVKAATVYFKRIRKEAQTVAKNKPADGYGYLGLCNDSNAALELMTHKTISAYPIARAAELLEKSPRLGDGLDEIFQKLPKDADADLKDKDYQQDVLKRIWEMSAHMISSKTIPDQALEDQLRVLKRDVQTR